ncbi:peptidylprolyl isomerase [Zunongwangia sp. HRR-M8]|uniref:peptidylprolyl isomerase n=1 Tax=Zunongwangia sp. HRR-M8 TaxID=3015170 RepID=UPI0022DDE08C|nr:peptidylprolyl isomerase [Zunongwangia sp. HRR-M8]WBL21593.1 peptidylprolyl isomerase [Zunongwangia sp. HRR-M8]
MQLKTINLKFTIKKALILGALVLGINAGAQEIIVTDSTSIQPEDELVQNQPLSEAEGSRRKVDGIAAVIGDYIILDSDVDLTRKDIQSQGGSTANVTDCQLAGSLMENKLYAHQAIQDSIVVPDAQINNYIDQQIAGMVQQLGSMEDVLEFYKRDSEAEFRNELFELNKQSQLAQQMRQKIVENIEVTPEEVRQYFDEIPKDSLPIFGDEVEISEIVIKPEVPEEEKQKTIDRLNQFRTDVLENDSKFATKAILYSDDTQTGGDILSFGRKDPFAKEFKDVAFSLREGEISEPFETDFGYHIVQLVKIRGQEIDVRHILLIPDVNNDALEKAKEKIDKVREKIENGDIEFAQAAREVSDREETKADGGKMRNPTTGDSRFEQTKLDTKLYNQISDLKEGEISYRITEQDRMGRPFYKIIKMDKRIPQHTANYGSDYMKIKELALQDKRIKAIQEWQKEKIQDTYVKVSGKYRDCEYTSNWLKK